MFKSGMVKKINYIFDKKQKIRLVELMILILIGTALETVGVTAIIPFISAIMYPNKILSNRYALRIYELLNLQDISGLIVIMAILLMVVYILKNAFLLFMYGAQFRFVYNNQRRLSTKLMKCYLMQPYSFHLIHNSSELMNSIMGDVDVFYTTVLQFIGVVTDVCVCLALAVVLFITDKTITMGVVAILLVFILTYYKWLKKKIITLGERRRISAAKALQMIQQAFGGVKELKVTGREKYFVKSYDKYYGETFDARRMVATYSMRPKPLMETICIVALLSIVSIKVLRGVDAEYFIPTLSVFALAVIRILPSSSRISTNLNNIVFGKSSVDAIYEDIKEADKLMSNVEQNNDKADDITLDDAIKIENLTFSYDGIKKIFNHANMTIKKNTSVAFVGSSGAGKTTLADIILGVLDYTEGDIYIDDVNLKENRRGWQNKIGYISQNIYITDDTIRRNIAFALDDEEIDDAKVWDAIEKAQLKEFVESLEDGLDTTIGERGARISGGQRQRIGIARALYNDPNVLILDEATSALDNETEKAVMESIDSLQGKKTMIIIAHRITTIQNCDYVYKIEGGSILDYKDKLKR